MGLSKLHWETLSWNGFLSLFGLEAHPCSALASPGANVAQRENRRVAIGVARCLLRHEGDYGDGVATRRSRLAAEELRGWVAEVQRLPPPRVLANPQTPAGVGAAPRRGERRGGAAPWAGMGSQLFALPFHVWAVVPGVWVPLVQPLRTLR